LRLQDGKLCGKRGQTENNSGLAMRGKEYMGMGDESRVTQAIRRVKQAAELGLVRLKRQIEERAAGPRKQKIGSP